MQFVILAAVLFHLSYGLGANKGIYQSQVSEKTSIRPISLLLNRRIRKRKAFPEYDGKIFVPLIGEPYKDKKEAEKECKLLNGKLSNLYSIEHVEMIMKFIREDRYNAKTFKKHGGKIDLRLGMGYLMKAKTSSALRYRDKSMAPLDLQNKWIYSRSMSELLHTPRKNVILRVNRNDNFGAGFLYRAQQSEAMIGVLCELEPFSVPAGDSTTQKTHGITMTLRFLPLKY